MPRFVIDVRVMPRESLLDPEGQTVEHALHSLGFAGLGRVRVGKHLRFHLDRPDHQAAETDAHAMCDKLLANPVTEDFTVFVSEET